MASYCRFPQSSTSAHSPFVRMTSALSRERPSSSFENLGSGTTAAFSVLHEIELDAELRVVGAEVLEQLGAHSYPLGGSKGRGCPNPGQGARGGLQIHHVDHPLGEEVVLELEERLLVVIGRDLHEDDGGAKAPCPSLDLPEVAQAFEARHAAGGEFHDAVGAPL